MNLDHRAYQRLQALFEGAVACPPEELKRFVDEQCGGDLELRRELEQLLAAHRQAENFLELPAGETAPPSGPLLASGQRLGPYRLLRPLGRGGMGSVYLAQREDEAFRKRVAIKLLRGDLPSEQLLRHFRAERQILAALDHPAIARLLDGGTTPDGLPYFVMEYVEGQPIDAYCEQRGLGVEARLRLFIAVCEAVQFAHRNLVVHRDLKPSNILVTAGGEIKLLDFGIAKLLNPELASATLASTVSLRLMTPSYASPEQVRGEPISTASDVYSLGVLLYELLTGRKPYRLNGTSQIAIERAICEQDPVPPSTVVRTTREDDGRGEPAPRRRGDPARKLERRLAGDLDNIVLKALRKEPERRYGSAEQLAQDVDRHLRGFPVSARPATPLYHWGRFLRRNRWRVAVAAVFALVCLGLGAAVIGQWQRAERQARASRQTLDFVVGLFTDADPFAVDGQGPEMTVRQLLERGVDRLDELEEQPEIRAELLYTVGSVYHSIGLLDRADPLLLQALALRRELFGAAHPAVADSLDELARLRYSQGRYDEAVALHRRALELRRRSGRPLEIAASETGLAVALTAAGDLAGAEAQQRAALQTYDRRPGADPLADAGARHNLARLLEKRGEYGEAESLLRRTLDAYRRQLGNGHPEVARIEIDLGRLLTEAGVYDDAEELLRRGSAALRRALGDDNLYTATGVYELAGLLRHRGDVGEAEPLYRQVLATYRRQRGDDNLYVAPVLINLGRLLVARGAYDDAEPLLRQALASYRRELGPEHPHVATTLHELALLAAARGDLPAAEDLCRQALELRRARLGENHPRVADSLDALGSIRRRAGDPEVASELHRQAFEIYRRKLGDEHPRIGRCLLHLAQAALDRGDDAAAASAARQALDLLHRQAPGHWRVAVAECVLGTALAGQGHRREAVPLLRRAHDVLRQRLGERAAATREAEARLRSYS